MPSIEIPLADFRVETEIDYDWRSDSSTKDVTFILYFGRHKVVEQVCTVPDHDYEDSVLNDRRDEFDQYVAERLNRLFT